VESVFAASSTHTHFLYPLGSCLPGEPQPQDCLLGERTSRELVILGPGTLLNWSADWRLEPAIGSR
jgi:hypothetical protein